MSLLRRQPDPKLDWLSSQPWWSELSPRDLRTLAALGDRTTLAPGRLFMDEDSVGREAAVIVSGEAEVIRDGEVIARIGPGEVVGELSLLDDRPRRNAAVRSVGELELLVFGVAEFQQVMDQVEAVHDQVRAAAERHGA